MVLELSGAYKSVTDYLRFRDKSRKNNSVKTEYEGKFITKKEYWDMVEKYKHMFKERGLTKGRAVTLCNLNSPEFEFMYCALLDLGVIVSPVSIKFLLVDMYKQTLERKIDILILSAEYCTLNSAHYAPELNRSFEELINHSSGKSLNEIYFTSTGRYRSEVKEEEYERNHNFRESIANLKLSKNINIIYPDEFKSMVEYQPITLIPTENLMDDVATYSNTGGTTGEPKCAFHTHRNIVSLLVSHEPQNFKHFNLIEGDKSLPLIPFSHITAQFYALLTRRAAGMNMVYDPDVFSNPFTILNVLSKNKINDWVAPFGLYQLLAYLIMQVKMGSNDLNHLYSNLCGGEATPLNPTLQVNAVLESVGSTKINIGTGSTEAGSGYMASYGNENRTNESGYFFPGAKGLVIDPNTGKKAKDGDYGIFYFNSPWNMGGYLNDIEATNRFFNYIDPNTGEKYGTNHDFVRVVGEFDGHALHEMSGRDTDFVLPTGKENYVPGINFDKNGNIVHVDLKQGKFLFEMRDELLNIPGVKEAQALILPESSISMEGYPVIDIVLVPDVPIIPILMAAYKKYNENNNEFKPKGIMVLTHFERSRSSDKREVISLYDLRDNYYFIDEGERIFKVSFPVDGEPVYEEVNECEVIAIKPPTPKDVFSLKKRR